MTKEDFYRAMGFEPYMRDNTPQGYLGRRDDEGILRRMDEDDLREYDNYYDRLTGQKDAQGRPLYGTDLTGLQPNGVTVGGTLGRFDDTMLNGQMVRRVGAGWQDFARAGGDFAQVINSLPESARGGYDPNIGYYMPVAAAQQVEDVQGRRNPSGFQSMASAFGQTVGLAWGITSLAGALLPASMMPAGGYQSLFSSLGEHAAGAGGSLSDIGNALGLGGGSGSSVLDVINDVPYGVNPRGLAGATDEIDAISRLDTIGGGQGATAGAQALGFNTVQEALASVNPAWVGAAAAAAGATGGTGGIGAGTVVQGAGVAAAGAGAAGLGTDETADLDPDEISGGNLLLDGDGNPIATTNDDAERINDDMQEGDNGVTTGVDPDAERIFDDLQEGNNGTTTGGGKLSAAELASLGKLLGIPISTLAGLLGAGVTGALGASAAQKAAEAQERAAAAAIAEQRRQYDLTRSDNAPFLATGTAANARLKQLLGIDTTYTGADSGSLTRKFTDADMQADPVYKSGLQFGLDEGTKGVNARAIGGSMYDSGATLKALTRYGSDYASTKGNESFNRFQTENTGIYNKYAGVSGAGQNAVNTVASAGQNAANNISDNLTGAGNARAAGIVGGASAWGSAAQGINNTFNNYNSNAILERLLASRGY